MWKPEDSVDEIRYVDELPERDIGPNTSDEVVLQELKQIANEYGRLNLDVEVSRMKKLEDIYRFTEDPGVGQALNDVGDYKSQIKERKKIVEKLFSTQGKQTGPLKRKKGPLAITDGSGVDLDGDSRAMDNNMKSMENRILEAARVLQMKGTNPELQRALQNYHEVFKQSLDTIENIGRARSTNRVKSNCIQKFIVDDMEKTLSPSGVGDAEVVNALRELKRLNDHKIFDVNVLPFTPEMHDHVKDFNDPNVNYNDILDDLNVKTDLLEVPLATFIENPRQPQPAKSIMKRIEAKEARHKAKKELRRPRKTVIINCEK